MNKGQKVDSSKFEPVYTGLFGSQNYKLDNWKSDKDYRQIVVPTFESLAFRDKYISFIEEGKDGHTEGKDIRLFIKALKSMSLADIEILYSTEININNRYNEEVRQLISIRDDIVKSNPYRMYEVILGVMRNVTYKQLSKEYTGKKACQVIRYYDIFDRFLLGKENYEDVLDTSKSERYQFMKDTKEEKIDKSKVMEELGFYIKLVEAHEVKINKDINKETFKKLDEILLNIIKKRAKIDLL